MSEKLTHRYTNGGSNEGPQKIYQTSLYYGIEGYKGSRKLVPNTPRGAGHSDTEFNYFQSGTKALGETKFRSQTKRKKLLLLPNKLKRLIIVIIYMYIRYLHIHD